tara:strand:- start:126 stop:485 length:360 start_codon:yes stop_codon:yes gene_type:complete
MSNYFDFQEARSTDRELKLAKKLEVVPETCLLHGALVMGYHEMSEDPCSECPGPPDGGRDRCKGRPMREFTVQERKAEPGQTEGMERADDATFRRLERRRQIIKLDRILETKDEESTNE